jgi:hypothetical protein
MVPQTLLRFKRGASRLTTDAYGAWGGGAFNSRHGTGTE